MIRSSSASRVNPIKFLLIILIFLSACEADEKEFLPGYAGNTGEIVVVCKDADWKDDIGLSVRAILGKVQYGLPQSETIFRLIQVSNKQFQSVLKTHRNVLHIDMAGKHSTPQMVIEKSKYARGQLFVQLQAQDEATMIDLIQRSGSKLESSFWNKELNRLSNRDRKHGDPELRKSVSEAIGLDILLAKEAYLEEDRDSTVWIRIERARPTGGYEHQISQGILVARRTYRAREQFTETNLVLEFNKLLNTNIPGPVDGSFMAIDSLYIPPKSKEIDFKGSYGRQIRGLWKMDNYAMGGPFFALATLDEKNDQVIYAIAYVFAPNFDKREYLREMEAMLKSITFTENTAKS